MYNAPRTAELETPLLGGTASLRDAHDTLDDTVELPPATESAPGDAAAPASVWAEAEPTTLSIPVVSSAQPVVLDEPVAATRSIESLMLTTRTARVALLALAGCAFAFGVNEASIVAMSSSVAAGLGVPVATIGLLASAFALTVVIAALPLAVVTRRWSRRASVTGAVALWTAGVVVAASAESVLQLGAGRVMSAAAHALFWAIVAPTAAALFAPHLRARTVTAIMLGASAAGVLGTPLVTLVSTSLDWRASYWALAGLGLVLTITVALTLPSARAAGGGRITRGDVPSGRAYARVLAVTFLAAVGMSATWTYIVPFFTNVAGLPASMLPVLFALGGTLAVAATLLVGRFLARYAVRTVAVGAGMLVLAWGLLALGQDWSAVAFQATQAAGWAVLVAALLNWAMRHTPWRTEMGAATYTVTMNAGAAVGPLLGAAVVATVGTRWLPLVSLALTTLAGIVVATADREMLRMVAVPRHVRAMRQRAAVQARLARLAALQAARSPAGAPARTHARTPSRRAVRLTPDQLRDHRAEWTRRAGF